ncbi:MAG: hypothetical protein PHQ53_04670, partial [Candidatus Krumholzibacteria bacterium]|nr:hypothetical protein [Candidatus Krumholzibacteria bacterium]
MKAPAARPVSLSPGAPLLVDVALPVPLPGAFTYRWTAAISAAPPAVGDLVRAPFGRRRGVIGLVVDVREDPTGTATTVAGYPLRDLSAVLPESYRLQPDRWRLAAWLAGYYALPIGEVVPLFHPPRP